MQYEVTFAGFGGQGIMVIGQILALAGMQQGKHVVWLPSYGPEMRGGTAYCSVVIGDKPIGSPVINTPQCCVVFNRPSFDKFSPRIKPDGLLLVNSTLIDVKSDRIDIDQLYTPANDIAIKSGNSKAANMALLGAFITRSKVIEEKAIKAALKQKFAGKEQFLKANLAVYDEGAKLAKKM